MANSASDSGPDTTPIFLACNVKGFEPSNPSADRTILLKISPNNEFQQSLYYYNYNDYRFESPCLTSGYQCSLSTGAGLFEELGVMKNGQTGEVYMQKYTRIDRVTGDIKATSSNSINGERILFEGKCVPSEEPTEVQTQF